MIKLIVATTRKQGMSVQQYQDYWRNVHGPLGARVPGLRRYIQCHSIAELYDQYPQAYDGVAEAWFDDLDALNAARETPEWAAMSADAANYTATGVSLVVTDVPIVDALVKASDRHGMVKYIGFLTRKPGRTVEEFQTHWREVHAPLVVSELQGMRRYVQSHALLETYDSDRPPAYDGCPMAWFDSLEALPLRLGRADGPPSTPGQIDSHNAFVQPIPSVATREVVIVD